MREIFVMKSLKGHPNVVSLLAHTILDMGRTKEVFLVMEFCEKSLVNVLERRGAGYFKEKRGPYDFRDVCNAFLPCIAGPHPLLIGNGVTCLDCRSRNLFMHISFFRLVLC
ncbi:hypothetical protein Scep_024291 [Stephania cephalantha]|uniref:non-specific serine/threonine protein kinase n=1 Tax=Stephania cephalantha TaxID=152367 RepID=A0AAP0HY49_9MAGN